jgi:hypothetical protein
MSHLNKLFNQISMEEIMRYAVTVILLVLVSFSLAFGGSVKGVVKDADTGEPLIGANVVLIGTTQGATTDEDGFFLVQNVADGTFKVEISYLGYQQYEQEVAVSGDEEVSLDMELTAVSLVGKAVDVIASRAKLRETPVAFTTWKKSRSFRISVPGMFP